MDSAKVGSFSATRSVTASVMLVAVLLMASCYRETAAARPLLEINIQSLQRGPVPSSKSSPCGHVPNRGTGKCTLAGMNVAGEGLRVRSPPAPVVAHPVADDNVVVMEADVGLNLQKEA